jgi:hypothetical protein
MGLTNGAVLDAWRRLRVTSPRIKRVMFVDSATDAPEEIQRQTLVVVGDRNYQKWAMLHCPCGHGHRLALSLQRGQRPVWYLRFDRGGPTLSPSVDSVTNRRCHFSLDEGRVRWVRGRSSRHDDEHP